LEAESTHIIKWLVDASCGTHPDLKGNTEGAMSIGKGMTNSTSTKQNIVTRSSIETEILGMHNLLPQVLWGQYLQKTCCQIILQIICKNSYLED
jgi:hypothetical protein